ncbi:MAG: glycosyltransferase family 39 protein [Candidatus Zixiibacteriota bacterium]|nr:MAG: glycosyltransferase family 39 protein [candidate division Zixibacteria bacterium]
METITSSSTARLFRHLMLFLAVLFVLVYLIVALLRLRYPFELEWMEGACVDHVVRVLSGERLYVSPSLEFIPFMYTPLYFYLSAALSKIIGVGFFPLRLVSFISSLGSLFFIFLFVKKETGAVFWGILSSSLFAATYRISGAWFDIARADSLFLVLILAGLYLIRFKDSSKFHLLAGLLFSLSFLTKQTALIISLPIMLYCVLSDRRRSVYFIGTVAVIIAASTYVLNYIHDGWYAYYVSELPRGKPIVGTIFASFWTQDIGSALPIAFILSMFFLFVQLRDPKKKSRFFYPLMFIALLGGAWVTRLRLGSYDNVLMPACAALSILFGLGAYEVFRRTQSASTSRRGLMESGVYIVCIIQLLILTYNPRRQVPTERDVEAGRVLIATMAEIPGEVLLPYHGFLPTLAGKRSHAHHQAVSDIMVGDDGPIKEKLYDQITQAVGRQRFDALILDSPWFPKLTDKYYNPDRMLFDHPDVFWTVAGMRTNPQIIYVRRGNDND